MPALAALLGAGLLSFCACDREAATKTEGVAAPSETTRTVLSQLSLPVEIRFYSVLDSNTVPASTFAFAQRVQALLEGYERAASGKVKTVREQTDAEAAAREGLEGFNREKGDACFLGMVIASEARKETLRRLDPKWEQALEADVIRSVERVGAPLPSPAKTATSAPDPAVLESVKSQLPDLASVSVEEGTKRLRLASFEEFRKAASEMERELKAVQERVKSAQGPELELARRELQKVQMEQMQRLKDIAARSQAQIDALKQLKEQTGTR